MTKSEWYQVAKDFQAVIAATIALAAAAIAYFSAQRVANKQARTTIRITQQQIAHAMLKEDDAAVRHRIAFLTMLQAKLIQAPQILRRRLVFLDTLQTAEKEESKQTCVLERHETRMLWSSIARMPPLCEQLQLLDFKWEDLRLLAMEDQFALHTAYKMLGDCDTAFVEMIRSGNEEKILLVAMVQDVVAALQDVQPHLSVIQQSIEKDLEAAARQYHVIDEQLRTLSEARPRRWWN